MSLEDIQPNSNKKDYKRMQEQPDSQAGDTLNIQLKLIMPVVPDFDERIQELRTVIDRYAERLATKRVHQYADLLKEGSKQTGSVNIDEGLQVFTATLTKEEQNDTN